MLSDGVDLVIDAYVLIPHNHSHNEIIQEVELRDKSTQLMVTLQLVHSLQQELALSKNDVSPGASGKSKELQQQLDEFERKANGLEDAVFLAQQVRIR